MNCPKVYRKLKNTIEQRFPETDIIYGELEIDPIDGKMRYPDFIRTEIFKKMYGWIKEQSKDTRVYLCMEPDHIWKDSGVPLKGNN